MNRLLLMTATLFLAGSASRAVEPEWPTPLPAKDKLGTQSVLAEGVGATKAEALRDALRSAVQQVVKTLVSTETLTVNDKVIRDEILTASAGVVEGGYTELTVTEERGRTRVRIIARVADKKVGARLATAHVPLKPAEVDGKALFAEAVTETESAKNTERWLTRALQGYPFGCVRYEVVGQKLLPEKRTKTTETVAFAIKASIDIAAYKKLSVWLDATLEALAVQCGNVYPCRGRPSERP